MREINKLFILKKLSLVIIIAVSLSVILSGCTEQTRKQALETVKDIKIESYMVEEQPIVKDLKKEFSKEIDKAKDDRSIKKLLKDFKSQIKSISTREDKIKACKRLLKEQIDAMGGSKAEEARKILKSYERKFNKVKSDSDLTLLTNEIGQKIAEKSGTSFDVSATTNLIEKENETSEKLSKQKRLSSSGSTKSSSSSTSTTSQSSSDGGKKKRWVPAVTKTITHPETTKEKRYIVSYVCQCGRPFPNLSAWQAHKPNP